MEKNGRDSFRDYLSTRDFVRELKIKNVKEWYEYCKSGNKPIDIPRNPDRKYKESGWNSWGEFLGTENISTKKMKFRNFKLARKFVRKLNLVNEKEWREYCKSGKKPEDIPSNPQGTYKDKGWEGIRNWLIKK